RAGRADLPLIAEDRGCRKLRRLVDWSILVDDHCALPTEFEADGLERTGRLGGDTLSSHRTAGEHDLGDHMMRDERRTCHRAIARHDVDDARRNPRLSHYPTNI